MNDYQMSKLSRDHMASLQAEAKRSRLANDAEEASGSGWLRRLVSGAFGWVPSFGEWGNDEWARSSHRRDAWNRERISH